MAYLEVAKDVLGNVGLEDPRCQVMGLIQISYEEQTNWPCLARNYARAAVNGSSKYCPSLTPAYQTAKLKADQFPNMPAGVGLTQLFNAWQNETMALNKQCLPLSQTLPNPPAPTPDPVPVPAASSTVWWILGIGAVAVAWYFLKKR